MKKIFTLGFLGITLMTGMVFGMDVDNSDSSNKLAELSRHMAFITDDSLFNNLPEGAWGETVWSKFGRQAKGNIDGLLQTDDFKIWNGTKLIATTPGTEAFLQRRYAFHFVLHAVKAIEVRGEHVGINIAELPLQPRGDLRATVKQPLWQSILFPTIQYAGLIGFGYLLHKYINPLNQSNQVG